jgi:GDP-4-dehydro-6-deoxy-D-mannose reductase
VTGARGFAGSHLMDLLAGRGAPVVGWGREEVDLLDGAAVRRAIAKLRPAVVYHCAGAAHVGESFQAVRDTLAINVMGTHHLLDALRQAGLRARVLVTGSSLVYRQADRPLREGDPLGPATPYAVSKLAQEMLARRAIVEDGQEVCLSRSFNHTGPRQTPSFSASSFARQIARIEKGLAPPQLVVGNLDASRDLHDVRDTALAYTAIVERGTPGRVYNVCAGSAFRIRDILDRLVAMSSCKVAVHVDPDKFRRNDNPILVGDATRIREELGWRPQIPLDRTLADLLDYWRKEATQ